VKAKSKNLFEKIASVFVHSNRPSGQIVLMLITASIFYAVSSWPQRKFLNSDPSPSIIPIQLAKGAPVRTGMYIRNFMEFDTIKNRFLVDAVVWFESDKSVSAKILDKFVFGKGEIKSKSEATIKVLPNGKQMVWYNVRLLFPSNLSHKLFPFGDHTLYINLTNRSISIDEIYFVSGDDNLVVADSIYTVGWSLIKTRVSSGKTIIELDKEAKEKNISAPRAIFALDFKDNSMRELWLILLPLFIFFLVALFSFSVPLKQFSARASMVSASLSATLSYRYVIQTLAPKVEYAMLSDYIFFMFLSMVFLAVIFNLFLRPKIKEQNVGFLVLSLHVLLNFSWAFLIFYFVQVA
jgi:hypothetical protein